MADASYIERRGEIKVYFDRTAVDAWRKFASTEKMSRIRETVRAGRERMRGHILAALPNDLSGWRVLDAGCGAGQLSVELARRGADVTGIDLAPEIIRFGTEKLAEAGPIKGSVRLLAGDMLAAEHGRFDAVVAMDSVIHYSPDDAVAALARLSERAGSHLVFTFAPRTPFLSLMHAAGTFLPRADRAPRIEIVGRKALEQRIGAHCAFDDWQIGESHRVRSGFYISQMMELRR